MGAGRTAHADSTRRLTRFPTDRKNNMSLGTILLIVLILVVIGALPTWGYSSGWGYYPSGIAGLVVVVLLVLLLMGRL